MGAPLHDDMQALARALDGVVPAPALRRRILEATTRETPAPGHRWWVPVTAFAAGVAITLVLLGLPWSDEPVRDRTDVAGAHSPTPAGVCRDRLDADAVLVEAPCRIELDDVGVVVDVWSSAQLFRDGRTIGMPDGAATFDVAPVGAAAPIEIDVGAGRVRVLGTRFEIQNTGPAGHLDLIHGRVEFHADDGSVRRVTPGQRLSWDRRPAAEPVEVPADAPPADATADSEAPRPASSEGDTRMPADRPRTSAPTSSTSAPLDIDETLEEVARLRHVGAHGDAETLLRDTMAAVSDRRTQEVLSFEIGTLLELTDERERACAHWRTHVERFADGTTAPRAAAHRERLECEPE